MGGLCSKVDATTSSSLAANQHGTSRATTAPNSALPGTGAERFTDEDGEELVFFDAVEEFSDAVANLSYAPATTMRARGISIFSPNTLLSVRQEGSSLSPASEAIVSEATNDLLPPNAGGIGSQRRDSVVAITKSLEARSSGVSGHGYPGELNADELQACLTFRDELKKRDPAFREMVMAYAPAEEEAFALCRFLRARNFSHQAVFSMLEGNNALDVWKKAREHGFYRDFEKTYGCPVPVFMSLFPLVVSGLAKNGATILNFKTGNMNVDALECVADLPELVPAMWDLLHTKGRLSMEREAKSHDPETTTVLSERIIIMDMKGMPSALFSTRGIEFMKESATITACFPETMNRTYLVNVSTSFSILWSIIKVFLDVRSLAKIGFFANPAKAKQDLLQFIDSRELLSEYGGTGPSFEEVVAAQQKEFGSCSRYIVHHMYVTNKESNMAFDLTKDERVDSIVVYSKAEKDAHFSLKKGDAVISKAISVKRGEHDKLHFSVAIEMPDSLVGPDIYMVAAQGSAKEHYVVAIGVCAV